jgi:preprotein translocase subunit SecE
MGNQQHTSQQKALNSKKAFFTKNLQTQTNKVQWTTKQQNSLSADSNADSWHHFAH